MNFDAVLNPAAVIDGSAKIFLADFSHRRELTDLWIEAFGDDEKFISSFLNAYMIPEYNVPAVFADGKIVSALYLIEFPLYSNTKVLGNCAYLFAAATKKEYRNKGYMSGLVEYSAGLCRNRRMKAVFLFPQNRDRKLFGFYSGFGFETVYGAKIIKRKSGGKRKKRDLSGFRLRNEDITDAGVFDVLYNSYTEYTARQELAPMKDRLFYFKCASSYMDDAENSKISACFAVFEKFDAQNKNNVEKFCYVFYKKYKNTYYVDDIILFRQDADTEKNQRNFDETADILADFIINSGDDVSCEITLPPPSSLPGGRDAPLAMVLPLSGETESIMRGLRKSVYVNMFMNV